MAASIFFSHSSRDRAWCELLAAEALKVGVTTYLAEHDPRPGTQLAEKVKQNIEACDAFVVLLTHNTANSGYVHQEIGCALTAKKLVIPLVQPAIGHDQLAMLAGVEYIEFDFDNPHAGVEGFATAIRRVAEKQQRQSDVETLLAIALCVALLVVLLSDGGGGIAPT
jgi:hypothetical protein